MNADLTKTYLDFAHAHIEPLIDVDHLLQIHRKFRETFDDPRLKKRSSMFLAALVHTITASLDKEDPHRLPELSDDSDPGSEILTSKGLPYGSPEAVADVLASGEDPAEQLERMALSHLDDFFAQFTWRSHIDISFGADAILDETVDDTDEVGAAISSLRFAIHRRRCFEGPHDPGLLVIFYHLAYMFGAGEFDQDSIDALLKDVAIAPGTYRSMSR